MELFAQFFSTPVFSQLGEWLIQASLIFMRILAFLHIAPVFSHKSVTTTMRLAIGFLLTSFMLDTMTYQKPPEEGYFLIYIVILNIALGLLMGFVSRVIFLIITAGGEMMDSSMGFSSAQMFDPSMGQQTTIMGKFMGVLSIVIFFYVGGPEKLILALRNSLDTFSLYAPALSINIDKIIHLTGEITALGFLLVSPVILTILVNDLILGLVSRTAPQINAFQISFTIKPSIGLIIFLIFMPLFFATVINLFSSTSKWY